MRKRTLSQLEKTLWTHFSLYIRLKASKNGLVKCYTCGVQKHYKEMQAGHYVKRARKSLKFDERNVKPQCPRCNLFLDGNQDEFAVALQKEYGNEILKELHRLKWQEKRFSRKELEELIERYKKTP